MRQILYLAYIAALCCLCSPVTPAQTTRPLTIRVDTVRLNVCGGKNFLVGVGIGDLFVSDSVVGMRVIVAWDIANLDIEDQVIFGSDALGSQFTEKVVTKSQETGELVIEMGNTSLRPVAGTGKPLFFLKGRVTAPDTVTGANGWIAVTSMSFESITEFSPIDYSRPGLVRVERDTTAAFTGMMSVGAGSFDTAQVDTVTLTTQNLRNRRINEITFVVRADTSKYSFVDTIETGTMAASSIWTTKEVRITSDSIVGRLVAGGDLVTDGALLNVVLRRKTDSAFTSTVHVDEFAVNQQSCLGKLTRANGQVSAQAIVRDTSTTGVDDWRDDRREAIRIVPERSGASIMIAAGEMEIVEVTIFDINGSVLHVQPVERLDASTLRVRLATPPPSGIYFAGLRGRKEIVYKQFTIIK